MGLGWIRYVFHFNTEVSTKVPELLSRLLSAGRLFQRRRTPELPSCGHAEWLPSMKLLSNSLVTFGYELWQDLVCEVITFANLDLPEDASDAKVWQACQENEVVLVTGNRNAEGPESFEITIRQRDNEHCIPVLTLAGPDRIQREHQ